MFEHKTEAEAREEILSMVGSTAKTFHLKEKEYHEGTGFLMHQEFMMRVK